MGNVVTGAKAGVISGLIYGIILAVLTYFTLTSMKEQIMSIIESNLIVGLQITADQIFNLALIFGTVVVIIIGIIGGVLLGAIFGWAYEKIPGTTPLTKGVVFGVFFWIIFSVLLGFGNLQYGFTFYLVNIFEGLVTSLIFGFLVGHFYRRFSPPTI